MIVLSWCTYVCSIITYVGNVNWYNCNNQVVRRVYGTVVNKKNSCMEVCELFRKDLKINELDQIMVYDRTLWCNLIRVTAPLTGVRLGCCCRWCCMELEARELFCDNKYTIKNGTPALVFWWFAFSISLPCIKL